MAFSIGFSGLVDLFSGIQMIDESKGSAFRSRLKHLQRIGFPPGVNTGKGRAAAYTIEHILLIGLALELIQLGITPERAVSLLSDARKLVLNEAKLAIRGVARIRPKQHLLLIDPRALSMLQNNEANRDAGLMFGNLTGLAGRLKQPLHGRRVPRMAVIDFDGLMVNITVVARFLNLPGAEHLAREWGEWGLRSKFE